MALVLLGNLQLEAQAAQLAGLKLDALPLAQWSAEHDADVRAAYQAALGRLALAAEGAAR